MRKIVAVLMLIMFVAGLVLVVDDAAFAAWGKKKEKEAEAQEVAVAPSEGKVVCSFKNDEQMTEFEQLYISKQATFGRMGVLQAYFSMEQNNLTEIDRQMQEKFGFRMDPNNMYDLNRENKEIRELGPIVPPTQP
ncbi:MAG: hypothetical protein P9L93_07990 [Candidatus Gorgyraea atricola]|nr:hypothetical protein [Candidatus Gorgyraea atricola]